MQDVQAAIVAPNEEPIVPVAISKSTENAQQSDVTDGASSPNQPEINASAVNSEDEYVLESVKLIQIQKRYKVEYILLTTCSYLIQ